MTDPPTPYQRAQEFRRSAGFRLPTGRDRCHTCGGHVPTQGHLGGCPHEPDRKTSAQGRRGVR